MYTFLALTSLLSIIIISIVLKTDDLNQLHKVVSIEDMKNDLNNYDRRILLKISLILDTFFIFGVMALIKNIHNHVIETNRYYSKVGFLFGTIGMFFDILENSIMFLIVNTMMRGYLPDILLVNVMYLFVYLKDTLLIISTFIFAILFIAKTLENKNKKNWLLVISLLSVSIFGSIALLDSNFLILRNLSTLMTICFSLILLK